MLERFNQGFSGKTFVVVDEIHWETVGDQQVSRIKNMVTCKKTVSEQKFQPSVSIPNCSHFVTITNAPTPCPKELKGRRYFPLVCSLHGLLKRLQSLEARQGYTTQVVNNLHHEMKLFFSLLVSWPTYMLDEFRAGLGVSNEHLSILSAASKKWVCNHSIASKWWFYLLNTATADGHIPKLMEPELDQFGNTRIFAQQATYADLKINMDEDEIYCDKKRDEICKKINKIKEDSMNTNFWNACEKVIEELKKEEEPLVKMKELISACDKCKYLPRLNAQLESIFPKIDHIIVPETVESFIERTSKSLASKNKGVDEAWAVKLTKNAMNAAVTKPGLKILKTDLYKLFSDWVQKDQEGIDKGPGNKNNFPNVDMLIHTLSCYVPWILTLKDDDWAYLGDLKDCINNVEEAFNSGANLEQSTRTWKEVITEIFESESMDDNNPGLINRLEKDPSFLVTEERDVYIRLLLADEDDRMIPVIIPMTPEMLKRLGDQGEIKWDVEYIKTHAVFPDKDDLIYAAVAKYKASQAKDRGLATLVQSALHSLITETRPDDLSHVQFPKEAKMERAWFFYGEVITHITFARCDNKHLPNTAYLLRVKINEQQQQQ